MWNHVTILFENAVKGIVENAYVVLQLIHALMHFIHLRFFGKKNMVWLEVGLLKRTYIELLPKILNYVSIFGLKIYWYRQT